MRTIRRVETMCFAGALVAALAAFVCSTPALAQPSANDINRIAPNRDLTRSIPSPGPQSSPAPSQPASDMPTHPSHRGVRCPGRPSLTMPALADCPPSRVVIFGTVEPPAPEPAAPPPPKAETAPAPTPVVTPTRPIIITHEMIEELQTNLQDAGNYSGPISGVFDFPTRNALIAWQRAHGKKATGSLNATTLADFGIARQ